MNRISSQAARVLLTRFAAAVVAALLVFSSYQPLGWYICAPIGIALLLWSLAPRHSECLSSRMSTLIAIVHSATLFLLLLPWIGEFVGAMPYIALSIFLSLYSILWGAPLAKLLSTRKGWITVPFVLLAVEWLRSNYPFGGFAWVRLAWGQIGGPLAPLAAWGGPALVSFATVLIGALIFALLQRTNTRLALTISAIMSVVTAGAWFNLSSSESQESTGQHQVTVAAVQGNVPRLGLDFNAQRRAVLANHVQETRKLTEPVDFVVWPENSSDVDPFADVRARNLIDSAVASVQAPIVVGTVTTDEVDARNAMVVFDPETGEGDWHVKKFLQPFGEWMPWRDFFRKFSSLVDLAGDFKPGEGNGVVRVHAAQLREVVKLGISTCYEVAFDQAGRDAVLAGAQILATPTNNATFGFTDMTYQQLAMSRMRAIELDRAVVVAATSGVSAIVTPRGEVLQHSKIFESATLVQSLPLKETITFSARYGTLLEKVLVIIGTLCAVSALTIRRKMPKASARAPRK
ncbi:apolipoprotein N-acyltransferase [Corynebacterium diphtheriae]